MGSEAPLSRAGAGAQGARLQSYVRSNLVSDLAVQAATVVVYVFAVRSGWLVALWAVRWVVVAAISAALVLEGRGRRSSALWVLLGGHCVGVIGTTTILPQFAPVTLLVLIGDLALLVPYASGRSARPYAVVLVATAAVTGALSMQSWTGLAGLAPRWLLTGFVCGHVLGTGYAVVATTRAAETALRGQAQRLAAARRRSASAQDETVRGLRARLDAGPARALQELTTLVHEADLALARGRSSTAQGRAAAGVELAQACLRELREISHGLFPEVLANGGLPAAVSVLATRSARAGPVVSTSCLADLRAHPSSENAVYGVVLAVLTACDRGGTVEVGSRRRGDLLEFWLEVCSTPRPESSAVPPVDLLGHAAIDRVEAVGGELRVSARPGRLTVTGWVPLSIDSSVTEGANEPVLGDDLAALRVFLRSSTRLCAAGVAVVATACLVTRVPILLFVMFVLGFVSACLTLAGRALRAGRLTLAMALLSAESSLAALAVTAVVPDFSPVTVVIAALPVVVSRPAIPRPAVYSMVGAQATTGLGATVLGLLGGAGPGLQPVPGWLTALVLPTAAGGVAALVGASSWASLARLHELVRHTQRSATRMVIAADEHRRRIERDLHDGAQQGIVAVALHFRTFATLVAQDRPQEATAVSAALRAAIASARSDLDVLGRGVFPQRLASGDLVGALLEAGQAAPLQLRIRSAIAPQEALPAEVTAGVFFACLEVLQNAAKHGAGRCGDGVTVTVDVVHETDRLTVTVSDDGPGLDPARVRPGRGLSNIADRVGALNGRWSLSSRPAGGVRVELSVPLEPAGPR